MEHYNPKDDQECAYVENNGRSHKKLRLSVFGGTFVSLYFLRYIV